MISTGPLTFGYFTAALAATAGVAALTGVQFAVIGLWRRREPLYLSYAAVCLCIAALALANAFVDAAGQLPTAVLAVRVMIAASVIFFTPFVLFIGAYTGGPPPRAVLAATVGLGVLFSWLNLARPDTLLFDHLRAGSPLELPWGERLFSLAGEPSAWGVTFHLLTYAAFFWALVRVVQQFRRAERIRAGLLGICLLAQFAALLWGDIAIDQLGVRSPYLDSFAFLPFVLLMGMSLAVSRMQAERALGESESRYRTLFAEVDEGFCILEKLDVAGGAGPDYRFVVANPAFVAHTGSVALVDQTLRQAVPALAPRWSEELDRMLAGGGPCRFEHGSVEDGRVLDHYACRLPDERHRRAALVVRDITARKRYDERQRLLLNELNHRVKNTLATVQSIAMQSLASTDDPARAYRQFEGRLLALSKVHDILTRESWVAASLASVVEEAMAPYRDPHRERLYIDGPPVWLPPAYALAFAMALHELSTNAIKYGALSNEAGSIQVSWTQEPAEDGSARLCLRWAESGGPPVVAPSRRGFGLRLLERGLTHEMDGRVLLQFIPDGVVCVIDTRLRPSQRPAPPGDPSPGARRAATVAAAGNA